MNQQLAEFSLFLISMGITGYQYRYEMWKAWWTEDLNNDLYEHSCE